MLFFCCFLISSQANSLLAINAAKLNPGICLLPLSFSSYVTIKLQSIHNISTRYVVGGETLEFIVTMPVLNTNVLYTIS